MPLDQAAAVIITRALRRLRDRRDAYALAADYYQGRHRIGLDEKLLNSFSWVFEQYRDNLCPAVVDVLIDRLEVSGFGVVGAGVRASKQVTTLADDIWQANRMDGKVGQVHLEAAISGDAYVIVWPDTTGKTRLYPQRAAQVTVGYDADEPGRVTWAVKVWLAAEGRRRVNLYLPDRIEKYASPSAVGNVLLPLPEQTGALEPYVIASEPWPLPNPYGEVPVVHFANNNGLDEFGRSELADVIPLQDALNKTGIDKMVAKEFAAFRQRWATGLTVDTDPETGEPIIPFRPAVDRLWSVEETETRFGDFEATNIEQFIKDEDNLRLEIARVSRTPAHLVMGHTGAFASGEALKTAESPLLAKVSDRQAAWGNAWEDVMRLAVLQQGGPAVQLTTIWRDTTPRNEREHLESLILKRDLGASDRQLLREANYSDDQIEAMEQERAATAAPPVAPPVKEPAA